MDRSSTYAHLSAELDRVETILDGAIALQEEGTEPGGTLDPPDAADTVSLSDLPITIPDPYHSRVADSSQHEADAEATSRVQLLADRFDLTRRHLDVLMLALAPELDAEFKDQYRLLYENRDGVRPTVEFVADLFSRTEAQWLAATELVGADSPLCRHNLVEVVAPAERGTTSLDREVAVTDRLIDYLEGHDSLDPALAAVATLETPSTTLADLTLDAGVSERVTSLSETPTEQPGRYYFYGPEGGQKHPTVEALAADRLLRADLRTVLEAGALDRLHREALLQDCPVHLTDADAITDDDATPPLESIIDELGDLPTDLYVTGTDAWTPTGTTLDIDAIVAFPRPSIDLRREFWEAHAAELPDDLDPEVLAGTFKLTQGQLEAALATARSLAGGDPTAEDIRAGCRAQSADDLDELSQKIDPASGWEDIHLREKADRELRLVREHITRRARVYSEWGFDEQFSRGTGVVALFKGKSGTGKTMAAEVLANDVGMDLYKIDLSSVISKYIGETEENLERIFEAAEQSNAILLFDEADSIFGDRAEVSDATDRYANVEVNYLLQRIESYDGVVLLTTNYSTNIDSAFQRRIDHTISFREPQTDTREAIWRGIFPEDAPTEDLDYAFLAEIELTGGQIKSVGQTTAILAAADGDAIEMRHVVRALEREFGPHSQTLEDVDFGEYAQHFQSRHGRNAFGSEVDPNASTNEEATEDQSPEEVVRRFVDLLDAGEAERAHDLYHSGALLEKLSYKERQILSRGTLSIAGEIDRIQDGSDKVVVTFDWKLNDTRTTRAYELRTDDTAGGRWRLFNRRENLVTRRRRGKASSSLGTSQQRDCDSRRKQTPAPASAVPRSVAVRPDGRASRRAELVCRLSITAVSL
ncbi:ATP-binding protein [Haloferax larsenii]|uniref:ATPase family associated with various cellular activities (AAA) n=1 Tax=Haloferax larsenii TaxID=302484 RepID=A0A1H7US57_HALLR|nr:AAA family ATPase [Haloferax larsenii]SEL99508.1 ATPase family associated with various cellular activities (AAA) [Haloferax larsenii]